MLSDPPQRLGWGAPAAPERTFTDWGALEEYTARLQRVNERLAREDAQGRRGRYIALLQQAKSVRAGAADAGAEVAREDAACAAQQRRAAEERTRQLDAHLRDLERQNLAESRAEAAALRQREAAEKGEEASRWGERMAALRAEPTFDAASELLRRQNAAALREEIDRRAATAERARFDAALLARRQADVALEQQRAQREDERRRTQALIQENARGLREQIEERRQRANAATTMTRIEADINNRLPVRLDYHRPSQDVISGLPCIGISDDRARQLDILDRDLRAEAARLADWAPPPARRKLLSHEPSRAADPLPAIDRLSAYDALRLRGQLSAFDAVAASVKGF